MIEFTVQYELDGMVFQSKVTTANSGSALVWAKKLFPDGKNFYIVG